MFMNGVLIDVYSQKWKAYTSDLLGSQHYRLSKLSRPSRILSTQLSTRIMHRRREEVSSGVFQRIKILLQKMMFQNRDNIRVSLEQAMQHVISGPANFQAAKAAILTLVSMNERAWSCSYGEDERDLSSSIARCSLMYTEVLRCQAVSSSFGYTAYSLIFTARLPITIALSTSPLYSRCWSPYSPSSWTCQCRYVLLY